MNEDAHDDLNKHLFIFCRASRMIWSLHIFTKKGKGSPAKLMFPLTGLMAMPEAIGGVDKVTGNSMIWIGTNFTWNRHLVFGSIFGLSTTASRRCCSNWNVYGPKVRYIFFSPKIHFVFQWAPIGCAWSQSMMFISRVQLSWSLFSDILGKFQPFNLCKPTQAQTKNHPKNGRWTWIPAKLDSQHDMACKVCR